MRRSKPIFNSYTEPGRNDKCPCGSGKKYKVCCIDSNRRNIRNCNNFENSERNGRDVRTLSVSRVQSSKVQSQKMVEAIKQSQEESGGISDASIDSDAKRATTVLRPGPTPEQIIKASADLQAMLSKHVNDNVRLRTA